MPETASKANDLVERLIAAGDGRHVYVNVLRAAAPTQVAPIVVLAGGFGKRPYHLSALALYLSLNGFDVIRFDYLNHVGLSEGSIEQFTLTDSFISLRDVLAWTAASWPGRKVGIIAFSLAARVAIELAAIDHSVQFVLAVVGVMNIRKTMSKVLGVDYFTYDEQQLPEFYDIDGHTVRGRGFYRDCVDGPWLTLDGTVEALRRVRCPVVNFIAEQDDWVDAADVQRAFADTSAGARRVVLIAKTSHDIVRNPKTGRFVVSELTRTARAIVTGAAQGHEIQEPTFDALTGRALFERRQQRRRDKVGGDINSSMQVL